MTETAEDRDARLNRLADEFAARHRAGERPRLRDYCDRHPDLAGDIRSLFPMMVDLEAAKPGSATMTATTLPDRPQTPARLLGDFQLIREIGRGGMGVVYEAEQISLGRRVALKLLSNELHHDDIKQRRFEREARAAARLHHTNIVPVHGFGLNEGTAYYVMQFIPGLGLDKVIKELAGATPPDADEDAATLSLKLARSLRGREGVTKSWSTTPDAVTQTHVGIDTPEEQHRESVSSGSSVTMSSSGVLLPGQSGTSASGPVDDKRIYWRSVARIGVQVAGAMAYAHKLGVLHRDIKPANLLLDPDGIVWVTDFGLAKSDDADDLTRTGDILGTLRYMPPEAFEGKSDARSDVYALGLSLYELVALQPAYPERDRKKLVQQMVSGESPRLRRQCRDAPRDLVTIIEKAIEKDPTRRYASAGAMAEDLQRFLDGRSILARRAAAPERLARWVRRNPVVSGLAAAVMLALAAGTAVSTVNYRRAEDQRRIAVDQTAIAVQNSQDAEAARLDALDKTYLATRSEIRALRLARHSGWRAAALEKLRDLTKLGSRNLDIIDLRSEAVACLAEPDVRMVSGNLPPTQGLWHTRFSPDGQILAVNDEHQRRVLLKDAATHRNIGTIAKSTGLASFAFHPGGALAIPAAPGRIRFHATGPGQTIFPEIVGEGHALNLCFSRSGERVAVIWGDVHEPRQGHAKTARRITVHETATGAAIRTIELPEKTPGGYKVGLAISPDGRQVASAGPGWEVRVDDVETQNEPRVLGSIGTMITTLEYDASGQTLLVGAKYVAVIWDVQSRRELCRMHADETIWDITYSLDGRLLAGACGGNTFKLWDAKSGRELAEVHAACGSYCLSAAFSPRDDRLAVGGASLSVFELEGRRECRRDTGHPNFVNGLTFDTATAAVLTAGGDQRLRRWDPEHSKAAVFMATERDENPRVVRLAPDGSRIAVGFEAYTGGRLIWNYEVSCWSVAQPRTQTRLAGPTQPILDMDFSPDGRHLAALTLDGTVFVWNVETGELACRQRMPGAIAIHHRNDTELLIAAGDRLHVIAANDGAVLRAMTLPTRIAAFAVAAGPGIAFIAGDDGSLHRIDLSAMKTERSGRIRDGFQYLRVAVSSDGRTLAAALANPDGVSSILLDPVSLETLVRLPEKDKRHHDMAFGPGGRHLALGGNTLVLWDLDRVRIELARIGLDLDEPRMPARQPAPQR